MEAVIDELNGDPACTGFLVQQPDGPGRHGPALPALSPEKDVDGLHPTNLGWLVLAVLRLALHADGACIELLRRFGVPDCRCERSSSLGRGLTVGRPLGLILTPQVGERDRHAVPHRDKDLAGEVRQADIVIAAAGVPGIVTKDMVKPGAAVFDVGVSRVDGRIAGDVAPDVAEVAGWMSPPGGVGPMTRALLLTNIVQAAEAGARAVAR